MIFPGTTAPGGSASTPLGTLVGKACPWTLDGGDLGLLAGLSFSATDLALLGILPLNDNDLSDLQRTVTYRDIEMVSLGVQQWGTDQAWTEVFGLVGVDPGPGVLEASVYGGGASARSVRVGAQSWTGVDSFGTPVLATGTGTAMTISSTAAIDGRSGGFFGTRGALTGIADPGDTLYLQNAGIGLLIGDTAGTGTAQGLTANRQKSGVWAGIVVPINAADTVATCDLMQVEPLYIPPTVRARPRPGGLPRNVFTVES